MQHAWMYYLTIEVFGFAFVASIYSLNFIFDKGDTAFKYITLFMLLLGVLPAILVQIIFESDKSVQNVINALIPMSALSANSS